jgi:hypothetical protein
LASAAAALGAEIDARIDPETVSHEINGHGLGFFVKLLIDDELEPVHVEDVVGVTRLIQSHGQRRPASSAFVQKDADGRNLLVLEILRDLMVS